MEIRKATPGDLEGIRAVYAAAKAFMDAHGNASQWEPGYPDSVIPGDIANGNCYVETENGVIHGVFVCILGEDPTYRVITDGAWRNDNPYATIHRLGSMARSPALPAGALISARAFARTSGWTPMSITP